MDDHMSMMESARNRRNSSSKWIALGMMQRAEHVRDIAEMLDATMEDLSAQMENLDEKMDLLAEATEAIQEKMEEIVYIMNTEMDPDVSPVLEPNSINPLPF